MKTLFSSGQNSAHEPSQGARLSNATSAVGKALQPDSVGDDLRNPLTDDELEAHIRDLGRLSEEAYAQGDPHGARIWSARMVKAICQRSPAKQAEMTAAIERRIDELTFGGEWAHAERRRLA